jgi:RNA polymerase sigma-70 factor (ECF subfamily)
MAAAEPGFSHWLARARTGDRPALGRLFESCRNYLLLVACRELPADIQPKGGASDLVQETFVEAQRDFGQFTGASEAELLAWLRRLLLNNVANFTRRYRETARRDVGRELSLEGERSSLERQGNLVADQLSPSDWVAREEESAAVEQVLARLPDDYRQVLLLRYREGLPFEAMAHRLGRTANAARKLWARALERFQQEMGPS